jgi:predicted secreted protein
MPQAAMGTTIKKTAGTAIAGLTSISGLELSSETIDTTTLATTGGFRTFISSFKDAGEVSLSGYFEASAHASILDDFNNNSVNGYIITFPDGTTWTFNGVVTGFSTGADLEDLISFEATIKVSGAPTLTAPL